MIILSAKISFVCLALLRLKKFFLVDDVVFIEDFDITDFVKFDADKFIPTLRMGMNLKKCYTVQKEQLLPELIADIIDDKDKIAWKWDQGVHDWSYPVSLDGHFFSTQEITAMIQLIDFSAPNTLEDQLQKFRRFFHLVWEWRTKNQGLSTFPAIRYRKKIKIYTETFTRKSLLILLNVN